MTRHRGEQGAVLVIALTTLFIVVAMATLFATVIIDAGRAARKACRRDEILNAAESGVVYALWELGRDEGWREGKEMAVPGGKCNVSVKGLGAGTYDITSTSARRDQTCTVLVRVNETVPGRYKVVGWEPSWSIIGDFPRR